MSDDMVDDMIDDSRAGDLGKKKDADSKGMVLRTFRVYKSDLDALERHFQKNEQNITAGVRSILREYVRKNGLL